MMDETLTTITTLPQSSVGSPEPTIVCDEHRLLLLYHTEEGPTNEGSFEEPTAFVTFNNYHTFTFGPPSDETISGHPLYKKGLQPYSFFKVENSSWIAQLEMMNAVHQRHDKERYNLYNHYIFTFHDSTLECVAHGYTYNEKNASQHHKIKLEVNRLCEFLV